MKATKERDDKDFAIEFGGYLADAAEAYINCGVLQDNADAFRALASSIYEFRKRRDRALLQSSAPEWKGDRYERALRAIVATVDETGRCHGHWHGVAVKLARAAIFNFEPDISERDRVRVDKNMPSRLAVAPAPPGSLASRPAASPELIAQLEAVAGLAEKATAGPWDNDSGLIGTDITGRRDWSHVASVIAGELEQAESDANAAFIAAVRSLPFAEIVVALRGGR